MSQRYFIGLDGGGSKTFGVLLDEQGKLLASARVGRSAIVGAPSPHACEILSSLKGRLCGEAGIAAGQVTGIGLGLNGIDFADEFPLQHAQLSTCLDIPAEHLSLVNDGIAALWGASPAERQVIVQMGSAPTTAYRAGYGEERLFDHLNVGKQFDLRHELSALIARMIDGRAACTPLKEAVLRYYGVEDEAMYAERLFRQQIPRERLHTGHTLVFSAWQAHDPAATHLVELAAEDFACTACAMAARVGGQDCTVAFGGGVIQHAPDAFLDLLAERVHAVYPDACIIRPRLSPAHGAAIMAAFQHGLPPAAFYSALLASQHSARI